MPVWLRVNRPIGDATCVDNCYHSILLPPYDLSHNNSRKTNLCVSVCVAKKLRSYSVLRKRVYLESMIYHKILKLYAIIISKIGFSCAHLLCILCNTLYFIRNTLYKRNFLRVTQRHRQTDRNLSLGYYYVMLGMPSSAILRCVRL